MDFSRTTGARQHGTLAKHSGLEPQGRAVRAGPAVPEGVGTALLTPLWLWL